MLRRYDLPLREQFGEELFLEKFIPVVNDGGSTFYNVNSDASYKACTDKDNKDLPAKPSVEDGFLQRKHEMAMI